MDSGHGRSGGAAGMMLLDDERFMREALAEARRAADEGEVPIGAVVAYRGNIIARAHNRRELDRDPSAHAEFTAMIEAARVLGRWRLAGCTVYVTLEPCAMCCGLMVNARIDRCVYGAPDPKGGAAGTLFSLNADPRLNHAFPVTAGVLRDECAEMLTAFFARIREGSKDGAERIRARSELAREAAAPAVAASSAPAPCILVAMDSFKGSATSSEVEQWTAEGVLQACPDAQVIMVPIADGGEGTLDAVSACCEGSIDVVEVQGPLSVPVRARIFMAERGGEPFAVIEMADAAGLALSDATEASALSASTFGVGELVAEACRQGARTIYLGLGGSATTDGGAGFLMALGARLLDEAGLPVGPGAQGLSTVASIELADAVRALEGARLVALTDVDNPLVGRRGAVRVFGPQKGVPRDEDSLAALDRSMIAYARLLDEASRRVAPKAYRSLAGVPGAGAAGGLGAAVLALGGELVPGADAVLGLARVDEALSQADLVITGEGMIDAQTAGGKAPVGVARRAQRMHVPVVALAGGRADDLQAVYEAGIDVVLPVMRRPMPLEVAMDPSETRANLRAAGEAAARAWVMGTYGQCKHFV